MKLVQKFMLLFCILFSFSSFSADNVPSKSSKKTWSSQMQSLYQTLTNLLIDVSSDSRFNDTANFKKIESNTKIFSELAHEISKASLSDHKSNATVTSPDLDPSIPMIASLFDEQSKTAYDALKSGHRGYARSVLRTVSSYCIACHTRSGSGPDFSKMPTRPEVQKFSNIERANFLIATRRYTQAFDELDKVISNQEILAKNPLEWERAIRYAMAITVRVDNNPEKSLKIINSVLANNSAPVFIKEDVKNWKKSVDEWKEEFSRKLTSEDGYYSEAMRLVMKAKEAQRFPADHAADIYYYRLTRTVHELLRLYPEGTHGAEALFLLGLSYEALREMNLWSLHELYYESCIRKAPHTEIANGCYRHYEQSIYVGYSGSGGISIPSQMRKKLNELSKLADPGEKQVN